MWFVFGVQSSASLTVPSGVTDADGDATVPADGPVAVDAADEGVALGPTVGTGVVADEPQAVAANSTALANTRLRRAVWVGWVLVIGSPSSNMRTPSPGHGDGVSSSRRACFLRRY